MTTSGYHRMRSMPIPRCREPERPQRTSTAQSGVNPRPAQAQNRPEAYRRLVYAVTIPEPGGPDVLRWTEVPDPEPGPGEVLIDVHASAVNRADLLQRQGFYPPPPGASDILGLECSGRIAALGAGIEGWSVGDEVCALLAGGGYAERVAVPAGQVMPVPAGVDLVTAAALPEAACTVWSNLVEVG